MKAKTIAMFNHKGGVSKTTTTYNLGWMLTLLGKRVLLVDGDPQCNLTSLLLGDLFDDYYSDESTKHNNIKDAVKMAFEARPKPIQVIDCFSPIINSNLYIIPGHMNLSEYDPALSLALTSNNAISTLQNLPGSFYELIKLCAGRYDIDYVLVDMNPGLSAINQTLFMLSDAFIVPTNPDPFSIMALKTLKTVLPKWKRWVVQSKDLFADSSYPLPQTEMKFVGEVIQRFNLRNKKAAKPYQGKIGEIKQFIESDFVPELEKHNMVYDITLLIEKNMLADHCLAEISEFGALLQKANDNNVPVIALSDEQINETGPILKQMSESRQRFYTLFDNVARVVLELVN